MTEFDSDLRIPLSTLTPVEYNPRVITPEQMSRLKASIVEGTKLVEGWNPEDGYRLNGSVLVNVQGLRVVAGNQRVAALLELGQDWIHADDVSYIDCQPGSPEEKERCLTLNNPFVSGQFSEQITAVLNSLKELPTAVALGLLVLSDTVKDYWGMDTAKVLALPEGEGNTEQTINVFVVERDLDGFLVGVRSILSTSTFSEYRVDLSIG